MWWLWIRLERGRCRWCGHVVSYSCSHTQFGTFKTKSGDTYYISLATQTQVIAFSIMHRKGRVWWRLVSFCVLCHNCYVDWLTTVTWLWPNFDVWNSWIRLVKFVTHASTYSTYLINGSFSSWLPVFNVFHVHTETYWASPDPSLILAWYWKWSTLELVGSDFRD